MLINNEAQSTLKRSLKIDSRIVVVIVCVLSVILISLVKLKTTINSLTIELMSDQERSFRLYYDTGNGYNEQESVDGVVLRREKQATTYHFPIPGDKIIIAIRIDPEEQPAQYLIKTISLNFFDTDFSNKIYPHLTWNAGQIEKLFVPRHNVKPFILQQTYLFVETEGPDPYFGTKENLSDIWARLKNEQHPLLWSLKVIGCLFVALMAILCFLLGSMRRDRTAVWALLILGLGFTSFSVFFQPVFNPYDEALHFLYTQELYHTHHIPNYRTSLVPFACIQALGNQQCPNASTCYFPSQPLFRNGVAFHTPLFYTLTLPIYHVFQYNLCHALHAIRLLNGLFFIMALILVFILLRKYFPLPVAFLSTAWILTNPNFLARASAITDDVLPAFLATAAAALLLLRSPSTLALLSSGLLVGLTFITKYNSFALPPLFLLLIVCLYIKNHKWQTTLSSITLWSVAFLIPVLVQIALNLSIYGQLFFSDIRGAMGETPLANRPNPFFQDPTWFHMWFQYFWLDSWTSFYDWTSGYIYTGQHLYNRSALPMGRVYNWIGIFLFSSFVVALVQNRNKITPSVGFLLAVGLAAPLSKFIMDFHLRAIFPAIRFSLPYLAGLSFLVPFALYENRYIKRLTIPILILLLAIQFAMLSVGLVRNWR
jgi:hypothetical protein